MIPPPPNTRVGSCTSTRASSVRRPGLRHERSPVDPEEPFPPQAAHWINDWVDPHCFRDLWSVGERRTFVQRRAEPSSRPPRRFQQNQLHAAAADRLLRPGPRDRGGTAGRPPQLVRRLLPRSEKLSDRNGGRARELHGGLWRRDRYSVRGARGLPP